MAVESGLRPTLNPAHLASRLATVAAKVLTRVVLFDHYRPELYYMRGPGPRWHAKHDGDTAPVYIRSPKS
jgi:hypothetical protein